jgi:3-dehydroquinate dehydratase type I
MNRPRICAVIINTDLKAVKEVEPLSDLFEVRIDIIGEGWQELVKQLEKPWIATNRTVEEGGKWQGTEARRIEGLLLAIQLGASIVDVEFKTKNLENIIPLVKKRVQCILSYHNLEQTPPLAELRKIVQGQLKAGADICKIVTTAKVFEDNLAVLKLISEFAENRIVAFAMGYEGQTSRVLSPMAGADFTYASIEKGRESAPGQITVENMMKTYEILYPYSSY